MTPNTVIDRPVLLTLVGSIVKPVGDELAVSMVQLPSNDPARLYFSTADGTAMAGSDYTTVSERGLN